MQCDNPRQCPGYGQYCAGALPPLQQGEFEVNDFYSTSSLLQGAHDSKIWVNVTFRGKDGIMKDRRESMVMEVDKAAGSVKVVEQRKQNLRTVLQGHLQP